MSTEGIKAITPALLSPKFRERIEQELGISIEQLGLGPGTTPEGYRYAILGYIAEKIRQTEEQMVALSPKPGRRKKFGIESVDVRRAILLMNFAHNLAAGTDRRDPDFNIPVKISARHLIELAQLVDNVTFPVMTSFDTLEQSVSRGKRVLGIGRDWVSAKPDGNL